MAPRIDEKPVTNNDPTGLIVAGSNPFCGPSRSAAASDSHAEEDAAGEIEITEDALEHIEDRHTAAGSNTDDASVFLPDADIPELIREAESAPAEEQENGRFSRVVQGTDTVGYDASTGELTDVYTVITDKNGELITAFPGTSTGYISP